MQTMLIEEVLHTSLLTSSKNIIMNKHLEHESDYIYVDSNIITIISAAALTSAIASIVNLINSKVELKKIKGIVDRK
jgi:hypothetical protein